MIKDSFKGKILVIFTFFILLFGAILAKAFKLQVLDRQELLAKAKNQIFREIKVYPKRGNIYDRKGNPLAINIQTYSIFTIPKNLDDKKRTLKKLSKVSSKISYKKMLRKIKGRKKYTWLARKVELTKEQAEEIKKLKGIYIDAVPKRIYPNKTLLSQTMGFVGVDNKGLAGLEYLFDKDLRGKPQVIKYVRDAKGRAIKFTSKKLEETPKELYLSIDKDIQAFAESALKSGVIKHKAKAGGVGVMDIRTGEILAMANYPTFNSNIGTKSKSSLHKLSFVSDPIEPGSTLKILTAASALEHGVASTDTSYYCERGRLRVGDHVITEAESKNKYEWLSMKEIIKKSSNIGTTKMAFDITYPKLKETFEKFKLGEKSNIELPGESRGIFEDKEKVSALKLSNVSFGQGIATTGIQMLSIYATIANHGKHVQPTIFRKNIAKVEEKEIISEEIALQLEDMLLGAVEDGTGSNAKIRHFNIAGKTSTAQKISADGVYQDYIAGFIGYPVGVNSPFVVYAYVDSPGGINHYGNIVAAPIFKKITEYILLRNKEFANVAVRKSKEKKKINFDAVKISQAAKRSASAGNTPNFLGLDKVSAKKLAKKLNIKVKHVGIGVVSTQLPKKGQKLGNYQEVKLMYKIPSYE